jgi:hypothetical protein
MSSAAPAPRLSEDGLKKSPWLQWWRHQSSFLRIQSDSCGFLSAWAEDERPADLYFKCRVCMSGSSSTSSGKGGSQGYSASVARRIITEMHICTLLWPSAEYSGRVARKRMFGCTAVRQISYWYKMAFMSGCCHVCRLMWNMCYKSMSWGKGVARTAGTHRWKGTGAQGRQQQQ